MGTSVGLDGRDDAMLTGRGGDVLIGYERASDEPVVLRYEDRDRGVSIIGKSGTGKSSLLEHLVLSDLEHGIPGMVIDPHGRLAERIVRLAPPEHAHNLVLLEVDEERPFGLNLLDIDRSKSDYVTLAADSVLEAVKKLHGEADTFQPRLENWLDLAVRVVIKNDGMLVDVPRLFLDKRFRQTYLRNVTDPEVVSEFENYDSLRPGEQRNQVESVINRLARTCRAEAFKQILGSTTTTVPFEDILNGTTMLIASLPSETLSEEACNFLGSLLLCALKQRIMRRTVRSGKPPRLHLYLDEYQRFASRVTQDLLTQGREYGAGITIAHQDLFSIKDPTVRYSSRHAGTMVLFGLIRPDAEELAGEFPVRPHPEWVETVKEIDGTRPKLVPSSTPGDDSGKSLIVNLAIPDADARRLFGCLLTVGLESAALSRADNLTERTPHHLIIDEFSQFMAQSETALTRMLSETRKYELFCVMAHQNWSQASERLKGALQNVGIEAILKSGRMDAEYSARILGSVNPMEVKHTVDEERTHPSYFSLPEQWEYHVQQIQNLGVGEAIIRLMDDSMHKLKIPRLPKLMVSRKQLQVIRDEYLTRYFVPVGIPAVHVPEVDLYPRVAHRRGGFT